MELTVRTQLTSHFDHEFQFVGYNSIIVKVDGDDNPTNQMRNQF